MAENDYIGIRVVGRYQDQNIVNTLTYKITAQAQDEHNVLQAIAEGWEANWAADWLSHHNDAYELVGLRCYSLSGLNKRPGIVHIGTNGDLVADPAPAYLCRTITLYTDSALYRRRGKVMLSGSQMNHFNTADNSVTNSEINLLALLGADLIVPYEGTGYTIAMGITPQGALPWEQYKAALARKTPSIVRSRRISGMLIG